MPIKILITVFGLLICLSCGSKTVSNNSKIIQSNSNLLINSNINSNNLINTSNTQTTESTGVNADVMKQVEEQQKESKRLADEKIKSGGNPTESNSNNQNITPKNPTPKTNVPPSERQTS